MCNGDSFCAGLCERCHQPGGEKSKKSSELIKKMFCHCRPLCSKQKQTHWDVHNKAEWKHSWLVQTPDNWFWCRINILFIATTSCFRLVSKCFSRFSPLMLDCYIWSTSETQMLGLVVLLKQILDWKRSTWMGWFDLMLTVRSASISDSWTHATSWKEVVMFVCKGLTRAGLLSANSLAPTTD